MPLTRDEVEKVALLARLELTDAELERMSGQLADIVDYIDQLAQIDTSDIEPMAHVVDVTNVLEADEVRPGLDREAALGNAPRRDKEHFLVPPVLGR